MKLFRAYIIAVVVCISIAIMTGCIFIADETAKKVSLGEESAVVVINSVDEKLYDNTVNIAPITEKLAETIKKAAAFLPPPINSIYYVIQMTRVL